jgi:hypothetical protein
METALNRNNVSKLFFEPEAALKRLEKIGDLFAPSLRLKQTLPKPFLQLNSQASSNPSNAGLAALEPYRRKRDFTKTREPAPSIPTTSHQGGRRLFKSMRPATFIMISDWKWAAL